MSGLPEYPSGGEWAPQEPAAPVGAQESNGKAVTALVLGICGIVLCPLILSIPALVLGYQARNEIKASNGRQSGAGMATAGIVLGWIGIALGILALLFVVGLGVIGSEESSEEGSFEVEPSVNAILASLPF